MAGAQAVQIFDSWAGLLAPADYERFALRWVRRDRRRRARPRASRSSTSSTARRTCSRPRPLRGADVLGICWRTPIDEAAARVGPKVALQGNLDPHVLFAEPAEVRRARPIDVLARMAGRPGHIMNLGHGILPDTPIASVEALVDAVHAGRRRELRGNAVHDVTRTPTMDELLARYDRPGPRYTSYPTAVEFHDRRRRGRLRRQPAPARTRRRRAAVRLRPPAVLRGALRLLRLQRGDHDASRRRRAVPGLPGARDRPAGGAPAAIGGRVSQLHWGGGTPTYYTRRTARARVRAARASLHLHAGCRDRRRDRSARHVGGTARRAPAARLQPPVDGRAGLRAGGPGGRQPHPELRADRRRSSITRARWASARSTST